MNYFSFHIGDWEKKTRLLSPMEKGVYLDLLTLYYSQEKPIMRTQCERIARAYANAEQDALKYILETFFTLDGDSYSHKRCEEEIAKKNEKSFKSQRAARCRWNANADADAYANASETHMRNECTKDAIPITNNQYPNNNIYTSNLDDVNAEFQLASQDSETPEPKVEQKENHNEPVPYKEIQGIYNSICVPGCRKCVAMTDARKTLVRTRMADLKSIWGENNIENFRRLFTIVSQSDFLMGRSTPTNGHENFRVGIDWILNNKNMMKIVEGNYSGENEIPSGTFQNAVSSEQIERDRQAHIKALREQRGAFL